MRVLAYVMLVGVAAAASPRRALQQSPPSVVGPRPGRTPQASPPPPVALPPPFAGGGGGLLGRQILRVEPCCSTGTALVGQQCPYPVGLGGTLQSLPCCAFRAPGAGAGGDVQLSINPFEWRGCVNNVAVVPVTPVVPGFVGPGVVGPGVVEPGFVDPGVGPGVGPGVVPGGGGVTAREEPATSRSASRASSRQAQGSERSAERVADAHQAAAEALDDITGEYESPAAVPEGTNIEITKASTDGEQASEAPSEAPEADGSTPRTRSLGIKATLQTRECPPCGCEMSGVVVAGGGEVSLWHARSTPGSDDCSDTVEVRGTITRNSAGRIVLNFDSAPDTFGSLWLKL